MGDNTKHKMDEPTKSFLAIVANQHGYPKHIRSILIESINTSKADNRWFDGEQATPRTSLMMDFIYRLKSHAYDLVKKGDDVKYENNVEIELELALSIILEHDSTYFNPDYELYWCIVRTLCVIPAFDEDDEEENIAVRFLQTMISKGLILADELDVNNLIKYQIERSFMDYTVEQNAFAMGQFKFLVNLRPHVLRELDFSYVITKSKYHIDQLQIIRDEMIKRNQFPDIKNVLEVYDMSPSIYKEHGKITGDSIMRVVESILEKSFSVYVDLCECTLLHMIYQKCGRRIGDRLRKIADRQLDLLLKIRSDAVVEMAEEEEIIWAGAARIEMDRVNLLICEDEDCIYE